MKKSMVTTFVIFTLLLFGQTAYGTEDYIQKQSGASAVTNAEDSIIFQDDANSRIGISNTSPATKLDVNGDTTTDAVITGDVNSIRFSDGTIFSTAQDAIDDISTNPGLVVIPSDYTGAEPTSIPDNISILDLRTGTSSSMLTSVDAEQSGLLLRRYLDVGTGASTHVATGAQEDALSSVLIETFVNDDSQQTFGLRSGIFNGISQQNGVGSCEDKVAIYGEAQRGAGNDDNIWAGNLLTDVQNLSGAVVGLQIDMNHRSDTDPGYEEVSPYYKHRGLSITNGSTGKGGTAFIVNRNGGAGGGTTTNTWSRGIWIKGVKSDGRAIQFGDDDVNTPDNATIYTKDRTIKITGMSYNLLKFVPSDDSTLTSAVFYVTNSEDDQIKWRVNKNGSQSMLGDMTIKGDVYLEGDTIDTTQIIRFTGRSSNLLMFRPTDDSSPTSALFYVTNSGNTDVKWRVNKNGSQAMDGNLSVGGDIDAGGEITATVCCSDYVFDSDYDLLSLDELRDYIAKHSHLPNMTINNSERVSMADVAHELTVKVEEQALYILQLEERLKKIEESLK